MAQTVIGQSARRVTKAEAGRRLSVDSRAIERMIASGDLKVVPMPAGVRGVVLESSVSDLIDRMNGGGAL